MVPYRGRLALRIARLVLSVIATGWYLRAGVFEPVWVLALLGAHLLYAIFGITDMGHETPVRAAINTAVDGVFFCLWVLLAPREFQPVFAAGYLLLSTGLLQSLRRLAILCGVAFFVAMDEVATGVEVRQGRFREDRDRLVRALREAAVHARTAAKR